MGLPLNGVQYSPSGRPFWWLTTVSHCLAFWRKRQHKRWPCVGFYPFIYSFSLVVSEGLEDFRVFKIDTGQSFTDRALSYEGQTFYLQGKDGRLYPVPFKRVSADDQKYLIQIAQSGKIPKEILGNLRMKKTKVHQHPPH